MIPRSWHKFRWVVWLAVLAPLWVWAKPGYAQTQACSTLIRNLDLAINECSEINRNWVCYGSLLAEAAPAKYRFFQTRDRRPLSVLEQIETRDQNGVVLMSLQFEDTLAPVTVILFGMLDLQTDAQNRRALAVSVKDGQLLCDATAPGMVVHTDSGEVGLVTVNGVDIELASTAYITFQPNGDMTITNIEGQVSVRIGAATRLLTPGQAVNVIVTNNAPHFTGEIGPSPYYASVTAHWLADRGLGRVKNSNDTAALACTGQLAFGEVITDTNYSPGQECLYRFCAKQGDVVSIDMQALDPTLDPWLDLRGPGGWLVSFNDDVDRGDANSVICNRTLPLTSCDYTIIARSAHNENAGQFQLQLNRRTNCVQPELRCTVVDPSGSSLYDGPSATANEIGALPQGTELHPIERTAGGAWALVQVGNSQQTGWVNQQPQAVECEDDSSLPAPPVSAVEPTSTPPVRVAERTPTPPPTVPGGQGGEITITPTTPTDTPTDTPTATPVTPTVTDTPTPDKEGPIPLDTPTPDKEGPIGGT